MLILHLDTFEFYGILTLKSKFSLFTTYSKIQIFKK